MSTTEQSIDRLAGVSTLSSLATALGACAGAFAAGAPEVSRVWAAAGLKLLERTHEPEMADSEAEVLLLDAATDPLAPPWLLVDGLIALIAEQLAIDAPPPSVVEVDRSLGGLRGLGALLRYRAQALA
jgi:hypothetical protein